MAGGIGPHVYSLLISMSSRSLGECVSRCSGFFENMRDIELCVSTCVNNWR